MNYFGVYYSVYCFRNGSNDGQLKENGIGTNNNTTDSNLNIITEGSCELTADHAEAQRLYDEIDLPDDCQVISNLIPNFDECIQSSNS